VTQLEIRYCKMFAQKKYGTRTEAGDVKTLNPVSGKKKQENQQIVNSISMLNEGVVEAHQIYEAEMLLQSLDKLLVSSECLLFQSDSGNAELVGAVGTAEELHVQSQSADSILSNLQKLMLTPISVQNKDELFYLQKILLEFLDKLTKLSNQSSKSETREFIYTVIIKIFGRNELSLQQLEYDKE